MFDHLSSLVHRSSNSIVLVEQDHITNLETEDFECCISMIRKPAICMGKNKGADQLCSNCTADQRLCFRYIDSMQFLFFLNLKYWPSDSIVLMGQNHVANQETEERDYQQN